MVNILIGVAVVILLIARQFRARPARETSAARFILILGVIGIPAVASGVSRAFLAGAAGHA